MTELIILFGALILFAGIVIVINPETIFGFLRNHSDKLVLHILAVIVRLVLGSLLIIQTNISKYPLIIEIIGWLSLIAAFTLAAIGRRSFHRLMTWALSLAKPYGRIGGAFAGAFGAFVIYAFI